MKITLIAGARPNFMKIAPIIHAIKNAQTEGKNINYRLVHTGQHYDQKMSDTFFKELNIPEPDVNLGCGGGTQAEETTVMGVPCLTLRDNTERPETVEMGTNELIGTNPSAIKPALEKLFTGNWKKGKIPELWDGKTAGRIVEYLVNTNPKL
jgi:UDP-N-acetylglucosamine 2-epimerase